ncbi:hypothetical protein M9H77_02959 [Catharanthus roseus]|uniref:Uncharacterized protein n=1 Tax=Catharanthus roseus TaxID=4058 RepID=A0ACC0CAD8_CATRO|nr:hypothetical protein M9H77_02959 [Catharanthus roseus]
MVKTKNANVGKYGHGEAGEVVKITFFGPNDHIGVGKIYNQNTFKRMGFSRNEDGGLIRGGQEKDSENSEEEEEEEEEDEGNEPGNMDEDETNEEEIQREMRSKRRQEKMEEGSSSVDMG